jgi:DNA polymerase-3 subunit delta
MEEVNKIALDVKNKNFKPIYFLMGDEPYYIDKLCDFIPSKVLEEHEEAFNKVIFYGKDSKLEQIVNQAKQFPMGADYQVVVVKEAQHLSRVIDNLSDYAENPQLTTVLIIAYKNKKLDKRKALYKALKKTAVILETKKMYDNQVPNWIRTNAQKKGFQCSPIASHLLGEYLGTDLSKIDKELEKLALVLDKGAEITPEIIEKHIGISKDYNVFELKKALAERNIEKILRIVQYFYQNPKEHPYVVTIGILHTFFSQLMQFHSLSDHSTKNVASSLGINPYFVNEYITASHHYPLKKVSAILKTLREMDLKGKGVGSYQMSNEDLLKELIYKIL